MLYNPAAAVVVVVVVVAAAAITLLVFILIFLFGGEFTIYTQVLYMLNFSNITLQFHTITLFVTVNKIKKSIFLKNRKKNEVKFTATA
jgi:hypothetical protein